MKRILLISVCALLCIACGRSSSLSKLAARQLPHSLDIAMREQMETVAAPVIKDVKLIYDSDSLCVLQCRAGAKDVYGKTRTETVRYYFVMDCIMTRASGEPSYGDLVVGGNYLKGREIKEFQKEMETRPEETYFYFLSASRPVELK